MKLLSSLAKRLTLVFCVLFAVVGIFLSSTTPASAADFEVKAGASTGLVFDPPTLTIGVGDTVTWINGGLGGHNVVLPGEPPFSQPLVVAPGQVVRTKTFDTPGTYPYNCAPHSGAGMKGIISVQ
jgi:plastocyanin